MEYFILVFLFVCTTTSNGDGDTTSSTIDSTTTSKYHDDLSHRSMLFIYSTGAVVVVCLIWICGLLIYLKVKQRQGSKQSLENCKSVSVYPVEYSEGCGKSICQSNGRGGESSNDGASRVYLYDEVNRTDCGFQHEDESNQEDSFRENQQKQLIGADGTIYEDLNSHNILNRSLSHPKDPRDRLNSTSHKPAAVYGEIDHTFRVPPPPPSQHQHLSNQQYSSSIPKKMKKKNFGKTNTYVK